MKANGIVARGGAVVIGAALLSGVAFMSASPASAAVKAEPTSHAVKSLPKAQAQGSHKTYCGYSIVLKKSFRAARSTPVRTSWLHPVRANKKEKAAIRYLAGHCNARSLTVGLRNMNQSHNHFNRWERAKKLVWASMNLSRLR